MAQPTHNLSGFGDPTLLDWQDNRTLTDVEKDNLALILRFMDCYNAGNSKAMVEEFYHPNFQVSVFDGSRMTGQTNNNRITDKTLFIRGEQAVEKAMPGRYLDIHRVVPAGDIVLVQASLKDKANPEWSLAYCAVYTCADGMILSDHTYMNAADWPSLKK